MDSTPQPTQPPIVSDDCQTAIMHVMDVLAMNLRIPTYQRPYKWSSRNATELLNDITENVLSGKVERYRIGTLILHKERDGYFIVDGQQRILTLILICLALDSGFHCYLINDVDFQKALAFDKTSQNNLHENFQVLNERIGAMSPEVRKRLEATLKNHLEFVVLVVAKQQEAFQLFDSQNTRGKQLYPHDLLKAYHLRAIDDPFKMKHAVERWEAAGSLDIRDLFNECLYPILCWSNQEKCGTFTSKQIDLFKGVPENSGYSYGRRAVKAMPCYQLTETFESGESFFGLVEYYLNMRKDVEKEVLSYDDLLALRKKDGSVGLGLAKRLFWCVLMCYFDRFGKFDRLGVVKLYQWALMIRVDMEHLGFDTINKYAIGEEAERYANCLAMFRIIRKARSHLDVSDIQISTNPKANEMNDERREVQTELAGLTANVGR